MVAVFPTPVLSVAADAVRDLEGGDALSGLWTIFTKCKESLQDGARLENIAWRLWHRELRDSNTSHLLEEFDEKDNLITDEKSAYRPPTPTESIGLPPVYHHHSTDVSTTQIALPNSNSSEGTTRSPTPSRIPPSTSPPLSIPQPIRRLSSTSSRRSSFIEGTPIGVGKIIYDMLPSSATSPSSGSIDTGKFAIAALPLPRPTLSRKNASSSANVSKITTNLASTQEESTQSKLDPAIRMTAIATSPPMDGVRPTKVLLPEPSRTVSPLNAGSSLPTPEMEVEPAPKHHPALAIASSTSLEPLNTPNAPLSTAASLARCMQVSTSDASYSKPPQTNPIKSLYNGPPSPSLSESYARAHPGELATNEVGLMSSLSSNPQPQHGTSSGSLLPQPPQLGNLAQPPTLVVVDPTPNPTPHPTPPSTPLLSGLIGTSGGTRSHWLTPPGASSGSRNLPQQLTDIPPPSLLLPPASAAMFNAIVNSTGTNMRNKGGPLDRSSESNQSGSGEPITVMMALPESGPGSGLGHPQVDAVLGRQLRLAEQNDDQGYNQPQTQDRSLLQSSQQQQHWPPRHTTNRHSISSSTSKGSDLSHTTSQTDVSDRSYSSGMSMTTSTTVSNMDLTKGATQDGHPGNGIAVVGDGPKQLGSPLTIQAAPVSAEKELRLQEEDETGTVTISDDEEDIEELEEGEEQESTLPTFSPTASGSISVPHPSTSARTSSSSFNAKRKAVTAGGGTAASRRASSGRSTSRSRSTGGGSSVGGRNGKSKSRSRSREPNALGGMGLAALGMTLAAIPPPQLPPPAPIARKASAVGAGKGRPKLGRVNTKAKGVVRRNSAGPSLGGEMEGSEKALEKERAENTEMEKMRVEALAAERKRNSEQEESRRVLEERAAREKAEQVRLASEMERRREEERRRQGDSLAAPLIGEGSSRRPVRFNIGSNSDEGSGMGSKSAGSGSDASGGHSFGGVGGYCLTNGKGKEKAKEEKTDGMLSQQHELQRRQELQQPVLPQANRDQPQYPPPLDQQHRQMSKQQLHQLQKMQQLHQQHQNYYISSKPPSRQVSTKQFEPMQQIRKVSDPKAAIVAPAKQPTKTDSSATVAPNTGLDTDLAAKVRDSIAAPLLPKGRNTIVLATESEFETDSDDDGSWSSEEMGGEETQEQRRKEEQLRQELLIQQQRQQERRQQEQIVLLQQQRQQQQQQAPPPIRPPGVQRTHSSHYPAPNNGRSKQASRTRQQGPPDPRIEAAMIEAQRQRDMITKLPTSSFQDLAKARTRSVGLLTQLMNPNPEIFPVHHPYHRGFSSGAIRPAQHGAVTPMAPIPQAVPLRPPPPAAPIPPPTAAPIPQAPAPSKDAPRLPPRRHASTDERKLPPSRNNMSPPMRALRMQATKSAAALPMSSQIQVGSVKAAPSVALTSGVMLGNNRVVNGSSSGGYRPKGPPKDQELEDDSESEAEGGKIQVSSVAEEKLKALAGRRPQRNSNLNPVEPPAAVDEDVPEWARVSQPERYTQPPHNRTQSQGQTRRSLNGLQFTQVMPQNPPNPGPIPFGHPYNLPPPAAPMTPRTTRRQMLATELSESVRRNLLWERQVSKVNVAAVKRTASAGGGRHSVLGGLQPLTTAPSMVQLHAKGTILEEQQPVDRERERRDSGGPVVEGSKEDQKKKAMARNRSWADEYHYSGW